MGCVGCDPSANSATAIAMTRPMCHHTEMSFMVATIFVPATLKPISMSISRPVSQIAFVRPAVSAFGSKPKSGPRIVAPM